MERVRNYNIGVIDIGTNSIRLLIANVNDDNKKIFLNKELYRDVKIVKLGEDVDKNHLLKEQAIERTIKELKGYKEKIAEYGVKEVKAFATSAVRDSANRDEFLHRVSEIGINVRCISGEEEGRLDYLGNSLEFDGDMLVVDVGGGSTEFITKNESISLNMGCVRCTEMFFSADYSKESVKKLETWVKKQLVALENMNLPKNFSLIGVAGTATTQVAVRDKMEIYDRKKIHKSKITLQELKDNLELFLKNNRQPQGKIIGLEPMREDIVAAGTIILIETMDHLKKDCLIVSEADNLLGALMS